MQEKLSRVSYMRDLVLWQISEQSAFWTGAIRAGFLEARNLYVNDTSLPKEPAL